MAEKHMDLKSRQLLLFDKNWRFTRKDVAHAENVTFNDTGWRALDLSHDWSIEGPFSQDAPSGGGGGYLPGGIGWYRKRFRLSDEDQNQQYSLQFDGVYKDCDVWLNGKPSSHELFQSNQRKAFNGLCLAIAQSTAPSGTLRITASAPGLATGAATVQTS